MPKMKTKSALTKRVKRSNNGKLIRKSAFTSHLAQNKTTKQKKQLSKPAQVSPHDKKRIKHLLGK